MSDYNVMLLDRVIDYRERENCNMFDGEEDHEEMVVLINGDQLGETTSSMLQPVEMTTTSSYTPHIVDQRKLQSVMDNYENEEAKIKCTPDKETMRIELDEAQLIHQLGMRDKQAQVKTSEDTSGVSSDTKKIECATFTKRNTDDKQTFITNNYKTGQLSTTTATHARDLSSPSLSDASSSDSSSLETNSGSSGKTFKYEFVTTSNESQLQLEYTASGGDSTKANHYYYDDYVSLVPPIIISDNCASPRNDDDNGGDHQKTINNDHAGQLSFKSKLNLIKDIIASAEPPPNASDNGKLEKPSVCLLDTLQQKSDIDNGNHNNGTDCCAIVANNVDDCIEEEEANGEFDYHQNSLSSSSQVSTNKTNETVATATTATNGDNNNNNNNYQFSIARPDQYDLYHAIMATTATTDTSLAASSADLLLQQQQSQQLTSIAMLPPRSLAVASPINEEDELLSAALCNNTDNSDHRIQIKEQPPKYNSEHRATAATNHRQFASTTQRQTYADKQDRNPTAEGPNNQHSNLQQVASDSKIALTGTLSSFQTLSACQHENDNLIEEYSMGDSQHYHNSIVAHQQKIMIDSSDTDRLQPKKSAQMRLQHQPQQHYANQVSLAVASAAKQQPTTAAPRQKNDNRSNIRRPMMRQTTNTHHQDNTDSAPKAGATKFYKHSNKNQLLASRKSQYPATSQKSVVMASIDFGANKCKYTLVKSTSSLNGDHHNNREEKPSLEIRLHEEEPMALLLKVVTSTSKQDNSLLEEPSSEFVSFGQAALNSYFQVQPNTDGKTDSGPKDCMLFYQFKHQLLEMSNRPIEQISLRSVNSLYELNGVLVLAHCLRYIASRLLMHLKGEEKVRWIIVVPNEWPVILRQMTRMAAQEAGITDCRIKQQAPTSDSNLSLLGDIEAASYHCMSSVVPTFAKPRLDLVILCNSFSLSWSLVKWTKFDHVEYVCIENWSEHSVNLTNEFLSLIINLFGMQFVQYYKYSQPMAFLQLLESFELSVNRNHGDGDATSECKLKRNNVFAPAENNRATRSICEQIDLSRHSIEIKVPAMFAETFKKWTCYMNERKQEQQHHHDEEDAHVFLSQYLINSNQNNTGIRYDPDAKTIHLNFEAMIVIYAPLIDAMTDLIAKAHSTYTINTNLGNIENVFVVGCELIKYEPIVRLSIEENLQSYHSNEPLKSVGSTNLHMIASEAVTMGACIFHLAMTDIISSPTSNIRNNIFINGWPCLNSLGVGVISYSESAQLGENSKKGKLPIDILDRMIHVGEIVTRGQVVFRNYYKRALAESDEPILLNIYTTQTKDVPINNGLSADAGIVQCLTSLKLRSHPHNDNNNFRSSNMEPLFELELTVQDRAQFELRVYQVRIAASPKTDNCSTFNLMRVGDHCLESLIIDMNV